jgi:hypothetical protein
MLRRLLFSLLILSILFQIITSTSQCTCSCCKGNGCIKQYQGSINMPTCSATSCKHTCKLRYPGKCGPSPGSFTATCTKTKKSHRLSPTKKIKQKLVSSSSKKHVHYRP